MTISTFPLVIWILIIWSTINGVTSIIMLEFRVEPEVIQSLETTNVTLQCLVDLRAPYDNNQPGRYYYNEMGELFLQRNSPPSAVKSGLAMIRIVKRLHSQWQAIAQMDSTAPTVVHTLDGSVNSSEGVISDDLATPSFLQISWDLTTPGVFGMYRCDVMNFDNQQNAVLTSSTELSLGSSLNALDFWRLLQRDITSVRETFNQQIQDQTERQHKELNEKLSQLSDLLKNLGKRFDDFKREINNTVMDLKSNIVNEAIALMVWPRGIYGLLQPENGCPLGGTTSWETGWVRHHTESTELNEDTLSTVTHLKQPNIEKTEGQNFLTQHFCARSSGDLTGPNWPNGSFCINKLEDCPDKFEAGYFYMDEEDINSNRTFGGSSIRMDVDYYKNSYIRYCCRQDGPADVPIYLPNSDPFYLYRYGGKCQQVHGMKVTEEFVIFDTETTDNQDELGKVHPDGEINNVRLELCYYQRI